MRSEQDWNEELRHQLRETLRSAVLGQLRLAKRGHADILEFCREVYIKDECPDSETPAFVRFLADELDRLAGLLSAEKANWPDETDCDRLDRVEGALRERGILLWQVSPCCDTCTGGELPQRIDVV